MPKLLLKYDAAVIKEIPIEKKPITVGRKPDNDIVLDNQAVSGYHCKISSFGNTFFVEDLASTNGTHVNGKKIIKAGLHHNDVIGIIKHSLVFIDVQADLKKQGGQPQSVPAKQGSPTEGGAFAEGLEEGQFTEQENSPGKCRESGCHQVRRLRQNQRLSGFHSEIPSDAGLELGTGRDFTVDR